VTQPDPIIAAFVGGAVTIGFLVASLFFLKFWRQTRDPLFATFAAAFVLMAANAAGPVLLGIPSESQSSVYLLRLAAFGLIIWGVLAKNIRR
jgi:hypothetical protein